MNINRVILTYSHSDKTSAHKIANDLKESEIEVYLWELYSEDSLIKKIFSCGLKNSSYFLILVSNDSIKSNWFKELDEKNIQIIEEISKIILLLKGNIDIPLLRNRFESYTFYEYDKNINNLINKIYYPEIDLLEIEEKVNSIKDKYGFSRNALTIAMILISSQKNQTKSEKSFYSRELHSIVEFMSIEEFNDAIMELENYGLVKTIKLLNRNSYFFGKVRTTYALFLIFKDELNYNPYQDITSIVTQVNEKNEINAKDLYSILNISPIRLNRAVDYIEDYGHLKVFRTSSNFPYDFEKLLVTDSTRYFLDRTPLDQTKTTKAKEKLFESYEKYSTLPDLFQNIEFADSEDYIKIHRRPLINKDCLMKDVDIDCKLIYNDISRSIAVEEQKYLIDKILDNFINNERESYSSPERTYDSINYQVKTLIDDGFHPNLIFLPQKILTDIRGKSGDQSSELYEKVDQNKFLISSNSKLKIIKSTKLQDIIIMDSNVVKIVYKLDKRTDERLWIDIELFEDEPSKVDVCVRSKLNIKIKNREGIRVLKLTNN